MFEHSLPNGSLVIVHRLRTWIALTLAVLWLPVANHCRLETFDLLDFLACCDHDDQAPHQDDDCEGDACAVIESGFYKTDQQTLSLAAPEFAFTEFPIDDPDVLTDWPRGVHAFSAASPPADLIHRWQFILRAAQPVRAPSLAS